MGAKRFIHDKNSNVALHDVDTYVILWDYVLYTYVTTMILGIKE
jgi:hypothetical protein